MDAYLGAEKADWIAAYQAVEQRARATNRASTTAETSARAAGSKPSLPLDRYAGKYRDAWYGDMTIAHAAAP